jgi:hypothetical protein
MNHWHMKFGMEIHYKHTHDNVTKHCFEARNYKPGNDANFAGTSDNVIPIECVMP